MRVKREPFPSTVQSDPQNPKFRVLLHGLPYFCRMLPDILQDDNWDIRFHPTDRISSLIKLTGELKCTDLLFVWGARISKGKVLRAAKAFGTRRIILFWCGSDVLAAQKEFARGMLDPWVANQIHWAGAPWLAEEIRTLGIPCEYVPITWVKAIRNPPPLPERFSVLTYLPKPELGRLYGLDRILQVARSLPQIPFTLIGLLSGRISDAPQNLRILPRDPDMDTHFRNTSVYWRPVSHDGLAFMALEALSYGRHVMWSYPFPHCAQTRNAKEDRAEIERLHALYEGGSLSLNRAGADLIAREFTPNSIKRSFLQKWSEIIAPVASQTQGHDEWNAPEVVGGPIR